MHHTQEPRQMEMDTQFRVYLDFVNTTLFARTMQFAVVHNDQNSLLGVIMGDTL